MFLCYNDVFIEKRSVYRNKGAAVHEKLMKNSFEGETAHADASPTAERKV